MTLRADGRRPDELRPIAFQRGWSRFAEGSCLVDCGETRVLCTASVDNRTPTWITGSGRGWVTGEYGMLPRSCPSRRERPENRGKPDGRSLEIQRLIGRSLRAAVDLTRLGERTIYLDCDVLQADGGTRTAAVNGAFVALVEALDGLRRDGKLEAWPLTDIVAAVSVGIVGGNLLLDLPYEEDSRAEVDMNLVMTAGGSIIETQATAEGQAFAPADLNRMLDLGWQGIQQIIAQQKETLDGLL